MTAPVIHFQRVSSTNLHARGEIVSGRLTHGHGPALFLADEQTGGVGRFERPWSSPRGGLWCTLAWPIVGDPSPILDGLGLRIGVACTEFVESLLTSTPGHRVRLKWPNDVLIDGRKVLGVLTELLPRPSGAWLLVGVGLNANFPIENLPPDLRDVTTTLQAAADLTIDLTRCASLLAAAIEDAIPPPPESDRAGTIARARALLHGVGEPTRVSLPTGERIDAILVGLDDSGHAVVERDGSRWPLPGGSVIVHA